MISKKRKLILIIASIISLCVLVWGFIEKNTEMNRSKEDGGDIQNQIQYLQEDKMHKLGETVLFEQPTKQNPKRIGAEYNVKKAKIFKNLEQAGIDRKEVLVEADTHYDLVNNMPSKLNVEEASFLLCDIVIKNISLEYMNITDISLVCLVENKGQKEVKLVGLPAYFFKPKNVEDPMDYYSYRLPINESMDAKIGWWIDMEECKEEGLYLMLNYGGDKKLQQYWKLNL